MSDDEKYPEHAKLQSLRCPGFPDDPFAGHNQIVGDFISSLAGAGYVIARWRPVFCAKCGKPWTDFRKDDGAVTCEACGAGDYFRSDDVLMPARERIEDLIGQFFGIDPKKLADEKDAMLAEIRRQNAEA